jgi:predicted RNA binding protein YcfA (HicA-like mRNA interferase family)
LPVAQQFQGHHTSRDEGPGLLQIRYYAQNTTGRVNYFCDIIGAKSDQIKVAKLPQVKGNRLVKALQRKGWYIDRTRGSHIIMRNDDKPDTKIVVPIHTSPIKPGTLSNILKKAEISREELEDLL